MIEADFRVEISFLFVTVISHLGIVRSLIGGMLLLSSLTFGVCIVFYHEETVLGTDLDQRLQWVFGEWGSCRRVGESSGLVSAYGSGSLAYSVPK